MTARPFRIPAHCRTSRSTSADGTFHPSSLAYVKSVLESGMADSVRLVWHNPSDTSMEFPSRLRIVSGANLELVDV